MELWQYMSEIKNRIGRLYYCLSDDDKVKIDNLYVTYKDYLKTVIVKDQCPWFVNHGLSHINGVLNNMKYIIERFNRTTDYTNHLIKDELYFLLCAVIYHDIGMGYTPKNIEDINDACDTVREKHGEYSGKLLNESEVFGNLFKDHDIVATIMKYHQAKAPLNKKYEYLLDNEDKIPLYEHIRSPVKHDGVDLRIELLAALLQLADACDISKERVNDLENEFRKKYNKWYAGIKITTLIKDFINVDNSEEDKLIFLEQKLNDDFTKNVDNSEEDKLIFLEQTLNDEDLTEAIEVINRFKNLDSSKIKTYVKQIKHVKMVLGQKSHIEKHKSIENISFNDEHIIIKLGCNYNKNHIDDILKGIIKEIRSEAVLTDTTFSKYLSDGKKLFKYICVYDEKNKNINYKVPIFPDNKCGKLETSLKHKSEIERNEAWIIFNKSKETYLTNRDNCDLCNNNAHCKDMYSKHCIGIEEMIDEITTTCQIRLNTDELFAFLWAIWGHELCNPMILQNSNFKEYKSKSITFNAEHSPDTKDLFERGSDCFLAHTDYIFNNQFETRYEKLESDLEKPIFNNNEKTYYFNMHRLFWLLRYCELICKYKSYCSLDYPHWSLVALERCWPIDFEPETIPSPGKIAKIIPDYKIMKGKNLEGKAINEFLFVVLCYELNNMYEWAINNDSKHKINFENYELKKFDCLADINYDMYLQMCKDFASENGNQLKKISTYYDVRVDEFIVKTENVEIKSCYEFDKEQIKYMLLGVNGDYLYDIFMKSYKAYLFSWDKILENDNEILIKFLNQHFDNEWVKIATIDKNNNDGAINVFTENKFISLSLNDEKTKAYLKIDDGKPYEFIAKMENSKLNIYRKNFLHSYKCVCTGLKLNDETSNNSGILNNIINKLVANCENKEDTLFKSLYLYLAVDCNKFNYDFEWAYDQMKRNNDVNKFNADCICINSGG